MSSSICSSRSVDCRTRPARTVEVGRRLRLERLQLRTHVGADRFGAGRPGPVVDLVDRRLRGEEQRPDPEQRRTAAASGRTATGGSDGPSTRPAIPDACRLRARRAGPTASSQLDDAMGRSPLVETSGWTTEITPDGAAAPERGTLPPQRRLHRLADPGPPEGRSSSPSVAPPCSPSARSPRASPSAG